MVLPERSAAIVAAGHTWVMHHSGLRPVEGAGPGDIVSLRSAGGSWLGRAIYCPGEPVVARVITRDPAHHCHAGFFRQRALAALERRNRLDIDATQFRLVNAEGDGLPGITVDVYDDYLVIQVTTLAATPLIRPVVAACMEARAYRGAFLKMLPRDRRKAALPSGRWIEGVPGPETLHTRERDLRFVVRPFSALSTGIFLDQRDNRRRVAQWTRGLRVLNTFAYTGGFSVACARAGAQVDTLDISKKALAWAQENLMLNGLPTDQAHFIREDALAFLRRHRREYDAIILDPPTFSTARGNVWEPRRIAELHQLAFAAVRPGGLVITFSNTRKTREADYLERIALGAHKAGRDVAVLRTLDAGMDFPWNPGTPEMRQIKGFLIGVD